MVEIRRTSIFSDWLKSLRDVPAKAKIAAKIAQFEQGNTGDSKSVGQRVHEARIHFGPGYRIYYTRRGTRLILLLCAGDKGSQEKDIRRARELANEFHKEDDDGSAN